MATPRDDSNQYNVYIENPYAGFAKITTITDVNIINGGNPRKLTLHRSVNLYLPEKLNKYHENNDWYRFGTIEELDTVIDSICDPLASLTKQLNMSLEMVAQQECKIFQLENKISELEETIKISNETSTKIETFFDDLQRFTTSEFQTLAAVLTDPIYSSAAKWVREHPLGNNETTSSYLQRYILAVGNSKLSPLLTEQQMDKLIKTFRF